MATLYINHMLLKIISLHDKLRVRHVDYASPVCTSRIHRGENCWIGMFLFYLQ